MSKRRFLTIIRAVNKVLWPALYKHLTPEQQHYLRHTPAARRNLDRRMILAIANTVLSPQQIATLDDIEPLEHELPLEDPSQ